MIAENKRGFYNFGVRRVGLFGSFARGQQSPASDVDLLVDFAPPKKTYRNFLGVADLAEKLLDRKVEVLTSESVSQYLKPYIEKDIIYVQTG